MSGTSLSRLLRPASWTLLTKILSAVIALYVVVTLVTGAAIVLQSRSSLMNQVNDQLTSSARSASGFGGGPTHRGPPGLGGGQLFCEMTPSGTVVGACFYSTPTGDTHTLSQAQTDRIRGAGLGTQARALDLGPALRYQTVAVLRVDGTVAVIGLPLEPIQDMVTHLTRTVIVVGLLGLVLIAVAGAALIRHNLAPLRRVAATATRVSHQPLSTGEAMTGERVAAPDTDPRTEVGQVGSALNGLLDHVDRSLSARHRSEMQVRQFSADASHELRTPLASIKGYAELSRRETEPVPSGITHALDRIESEANRMTALVEDLLLLSRLDAGRPLHREQVDLNRLAVETMSDAHAAGPDYVWSLDLPEEVVEVEGDEARLRQVLINLLANGRRHTPPGTHISTAVRPVDGGAEITVSDTGPGIPVELQPRVFERFARGDSARNRSQGSTGLGLAIVHAVVAAHRGEVSVSSRPGRTSITLRLPAHAPASLTTTGAPTPTEQR